MGVLPSLELSAYKRSHPKFLSYSTVIRFPGSGDSDVVVAERARNYYFLASVEF
jgi:hypothetical protein